MGDFFLAQMGDFSTEDVCFDNPKEGKGERRLHAPLFSAKGRSLVVGSSDPMREAGVPSTEGLLACFPRCARPTGDSHGRITGDLEQRREGAKRRPRYQGNGEVERGQRQYKGRSPVAWELRPITEAGATST